MNNSILTIALEHAILRNLRVIHAKCNSKGAKMQKRSYLHKHSLYILIRYYRVTNVPARQ